MTTESSFWALDRSHDTIVTWPQIPHFEHSYAATSTSYDHIWLVAVRVRDITDLLALFSGK